MEPAKSIIALLGGEKAVSDHLGVAITAPYRWQYAKENRGTGGRIPVKYHPGLRDLARRQRVISKLSPLLEGTD